jgi:hypothetical protein
MKWRYFIGGCLLTAWVMVFMGAPLVTVIGGCALAGVWNYWKLRSAARMAKQ